MNVTGNRLIDMTGQRFGLLTVIERAVFPDHRAYWRCQCECGNVTIVAGYSLRRGVTGSCGCRISEVSAEAATTHGHSARTRETPEYRSWRGAKQRVTNPRHNRWSHYGGRGIRMCQEWLDSFEAFLRDVGPRPAGTTLDRIDVNGHYEPGNVRWATASQQRANRRSPSRRDVTARERAVPARTVGPARLRGSGRPEGKAVGPVGGQTAREDQSPCRT